MNQLALLGGSLAAILLLALVARFLRLGGARLSDKSEACEVAEATFADFEAERAWLDVDGQSAVVAGRKGGHALVRRHGARFVARKLVWPAQIDAKGPVLIVASGERLIKPFVITLESAEEARLLTSLLGSRASDG
ncbi:MAG: hypothetical protein ABW023_06575 [Sphingomonas sp.]